MHAAFLAAITAAPDDDLPRLVYADFLDESGDGERAEFIRTQIERAKLHPTDPRRAALLDRERALLQQHRDRWGLAEFRGQSQVFHRGFVEEVNVAAEWLVAHPDSLPASPLVRHLRAVSASQFTDRLARVPGLARLHTLDLTNTTFGQPAQVRNFFAVARLDSLRSLALRNCNFWEGDELAALADTPVARRLRELDLSGNRLADAGLRELAARPEFAGLERLVCRANEQEHYFCAHADGAEALADSPHLSRLHTLDLGDHYIFGAGLRALANSPNATGLEWLGVEYNEIGEAGDGGIRAVVESTRLGNLRELWYGGNRLGPLGAEALAAWPHLERMTRVDLSECPLTPDVQAILRGSRWAAKFAF
jgi:uncharacterized protein (TIGR02996 family)